ncbi:hypothetical protein PR048_026732 [Dryococelus australis]|uniref:RNase H type-1 domain-containing protein n=1 Tax=Dryococelus australis TaxID=614101 RepID=A0ABQ9GM65_9NEOP|nr:hypothetical protein PR048_026732 [Dryococelus australis]
MTSVQWSKTRGLDGNQKRLKIAVIQEVGYMENISFPPTQNDVVLETLKTCQKIAHECGDPCGVHYDLAVAKSTFLIQNQEKPCFDNVSVCFETFHIEVALFGAIRYLIEGSGIEQVLVESDVLDSGLQDFLKGKDFNRCKRIHILLSIALEKCHFQTFLMQCGDECLASFSDPFEEMDRETPLINISIGHVVDDKWEELQKEDIISVPAAVDTIVFDAMFILHAIQFPDNYGALANNILGLICKGEARDIHLVFDVYGTPTI